MTRKEQIEDYVMRYPADTGLGVVCRNVAREAIQWADEHPVNYDGQAYMYVCNKSAERAKNETISNACEWLEKHAIKYYKGRKFLGYKELIEDFKVAMSL